MSKTYSKWFDVKKYVGDYYTDDTTKYNKSITTKYYPITFDTLSIKDYTTKSLESFFYSVDSMPTLCEPLCEPKVPSFDIQKTMNSARDYILDTLPSNNKERKILEKVLLHPFHDVKHYDCEPIIYNGFCNGSYVFDYKSVNLRGNPNKVSELNVFEGICHEYRHAYQHLIQRKLEIRSDSFGNNLPYWEGKSKREFLMDYHILPWELDANAYMLRSAKQVYGSNTGLAALKSLPYVSSEAVELILAEADKI